MSDRPEPGFTTRALEAWRHVDEVRQHGIAPPLHQSATYAFDDMADFAAVAQSKIEGGYLYSRWANPTTEAVARTVASLEGAEASACFSTGMAAIMSVLLSNAASGDHIVAASQLYGGTHGLLGEAIVRAGIDVTRVDVSDHAAIETAIGERTRILHCETIGNPTMDVADLGALAAIARAHGVMFVVDATFTPPYLLRPLEHGVDIVVHSATKYLGGHGDLMAGVASGSAERIAHLRHYQLDTGAILAPFEAWLLARGMQTLALRMDRICSNAMTIARFLESHASVRRVLYPGLESHPQHELARKLLGDRFGGMLAFEVDGVEAGRRIMERVRVAAPAASLGATKTLIVHPASVTHTQLTREQRQAVGISDGLVRVSVGIEDIDDLLADLDEALA